jgi:hypothetical protein
MFSRFPIAASLIILLGSAAAWAEDHTTLNAAIRGQWVQFNIVGGRINLQSSQVGPIETGPNSANRKDRLSIRTENGETALAYEWLNAKEQFAIDACGSSRVTLRRAPKNDPQAAAVEFTQKPQGKAVLTLETEGNRQVFAAASLWHLFVLYPEAARKHLAPLLQTLQPNWKLAETADAIERELLRDAVNTPASDRSNWTRWVAQLGDENFARRQAADRALRAANPALLVYLQELDFNRLDAEQQFRIRRIIEAIALKINNDSPEQVASWLSGDPAIWLALLTRPDVSSRRIAAKQLAAILEAPLPVDPEADPASQKTRIDQLRAQLEAKQK